ncbi:MAG: hypothetical protein AAF696_24170, partial [Bacteroidota bacterium]
MKHIIFTFYLIAITYNQALAQFASQFEYKKGKGTSVFVMEEPGSAAGYLLAFRSKSHVNMAFLDEELGLMRMQRAKNFAEEAWEKNIEGMINTKDQLYLFMPRGKVFSTLHSDLYKINKADGSYKIVPIQLAADKTKEMESQYLKLVKIFQNENRFYKMWTNVYTNKLYIYYYEVDEVSSSGFHSFDLPIKGLAKRLGKRQVIPTPVFVGPQDASLVNNAKEQKIYMFEGEMLISAEDQRAGKTDLISINTDSWEVNLESYPIEGYIEGEKKQRFNSFIYDSHLYQILFNKEGLSVVKKGFGQGEIVQKKSWGNEEEFLQDFPLKKSRAFRGNTIKEKDIESLWQYLSESLAVVILEEGERERIIIGAHSYMDQEVRDILGGLAVAASIGSAAAGGFNLFGNGGGFNIYIDPFNAINAIIDISFYYGAGKKSQVDGFMNTDNFEIQLDENIAPTDWENIILQINTLENTEKLHSR